MNDPDSEGMTKAERRRLVIRAVLRPTLTSTCLVVLYFVLPIGERATATTEALLAVGLLAVVVLIALQARAIARSRFPRIRAIEAFALSVPLFLVIFSASYFLMERAQPVAFSQHLTRLDALYFTVTVFSSVGFGDIVPRSEPARIVTTIQMLGNLLLIGVAVRILLGAVQVGLRRKTTADTKEH
ncbi:voltage-gated potassium channel [Streptacidiphilus sp. MAP12-20]|uniref:potassium channel family protein n=1 Tax=Streptacidiphilus sp. MAP12-20 TaxID=3156299 RepID=UPI003516F396